MIEKALEHSPTAATYFFSRQVTAAHPGEGLVEGPAYAFDPFAYAASGACTIEPLAGEYVQTTTMWDGAHGTERPAHGAFSVAWDGRALHLYWFTPG
ncbi:MAG: hypothetical protein JWM87_3063, partial [Candidatus Eremiobacteraeota bacterium]|nr:hypothetical protein [Candidatus Eremiobacteraeota bacterium]